MRRLFSNSLAAVAVAAAVSSTACWSTPEPANKATSTPSANTNTVAAAPGQTVQPMPTIDLPAATSNRELSGDTIADRANRKPQADVRPDATPAPLKFTPAPENSEMAVAMQADGLIVETRVFKKHPTLSRAELSYGKGERILKVTLRDGRSATVKADNVEALRNMKAAQIIAMASK
ncbi:MAG: hypothetical protein ABL959_06980 [Pyrinomonadaceae bacterium]